MKLKLNGTHQLLVYADDVTLLGNNRDKTKKNTETLIDARKEGVVGVIAEDTKFTISSPECREKS
jgi:hypothetical protein